MEKIFIRSLLPSDTEAMYRIYSDEDLCLRCGAYPVHSMADAERKLHNLIENGDSFAIVKTDGLQVIGVISLRKDIHRFNRNAYMLGYLLDRNYWGQGIMPQAVKFMMKVAFMNLGADVVAAAHFVGNEQSKRVLEKCGFTYEGTMRRDYLRYDGAVLDSCVYSILYEEYLKLK